MAVDTANERRSKLGRHVLPLADGAIGQADRQHKVWKYAGILATEAVQVPSLVAPLIRRAPTTSPTAIRRSSTAAATVLRRAPTTGNGVIRRM